MLMKISIVISISFVVKVLYFKNDVQNHNEKMALSTYVYHYLSVSDIHFFEEI